MTTKRESKRILSVKVTREFDDDGDTSWLGEYGNKSESDYTIDREHSLDCIVNDPIERGRLDDVISQLERAITYLDKQRIAEADDRYAYDDQSDLYDSLGEAQDVLIECQDKLREDQDCDGDCHGDRGRNEYRYFNPSFNYVDKFGAALPENTPAEVMQYVRQDYERMESLNRGSWSFIGIRAEAEVQLTGDLCQTITSGGLWGIESDSDDSYFREVESDELDSLKTELHAIGFSKRAIAAAFRNVEHTEV